MRDAKSILALLALFAFIAIILRSFLGRMTSFFILPIDSFLMVSESVPPTLMWMFLGLLIGLLVGSVVAIKKYKLDKKLLIYPLIIVLVLLSLVFLVSQYSRTHGNHSDRVNQDDTKPAESSKTNAFDDNLKKGIQAVKNEEYEEATIFFKLANKLDPKDSRIDSLARLYVQIGNEKCTLYRKRKNLRYIPNAYYKYAAALKNNNPKICK